MDNITNEKTELDQQIGERWLSNGLDEHASVASFCKFVLQMMALGAPPNLIGRAISAMQDEVNHAVLCFKIAAKYNGYNSSPGEFPTAGIGSKPIVDSEVLEETIVEACVNETLAHHFDTLAAQRAIDPLIVEALGSIVSEETEHGILAWDFVEWLLKRKPELVEHARTAFDNSMNVELPYEEIDTALLEYGFVSHEEKLKIRKEVFHEKLKPRFNRLIDEIEAEAEIA